jgi:histidinol dehydrogenase
MKVERHDWDGDDAPALARRLRAAAPGLGEVTDEVGAIIERVRVGGDAAVRELSRRFGEPAPTSLRVDPEQLANAPALLAPEVGEALRVAAANITTVAGALAESAVRPTAVNLDSGQRVELVSSPVQAAGVYAPGGRVPYASSVLMCALPARAAGVSRLAVVSPPAAGGRPADAVLAACAIAGVDEVYAVGGAQAIAALAHGTESIAAVDVIAGPGNRYVTEAKRQLTGLVGIDGLAGPSELVVVADASADPDWIALDLCAQAEHGDDSPLFLVSSDSALTDQVGERVAELARERPSIAAAPLALVTAPGLEPALGLADAIAPEHLELAFDGAADRARERVAGAVFVGDAGATAFGDYAAGSNHVLPTGGAARFGGPLGPVAFMRRTSVVSVPADAAESLAPHVGALARAEGLPVHGESAEARTRR